MQVGVGSRNPVKLAAAERALAAAGIEAEVAAMDVDSGVGDQPIGDEQTIRGAEARARQALAGADLGIGLEGGVADRPQGCYLIMWAAATDGDETKLGCGPRLRVPAGIADRVRGGEELGPVMDDVVGQSDVKRNQGAAGVLTAGMIDREQALLQAVAGALGPFVAEVYPEPDLP
ncbi:MAG: inosine/xanthosine triphosphatase [Halobacteriales archaeon]